MSYQSDLERKVAMIWQRSHIAKDSILTYLDWVRRFQRYCKQNGDEEISQLTWKRVRIFADSYAGPRKKESYADLTHHSAYNAVHAWACALRLLGMPVPIWQERPCVQVDDPLLSAYIEYCRSQLGVQETTIHRNIETIKTFIALLKSRRKKINKVKAIDIDFFVKRRSKTISRISLARECSSLRSFLRYLHLSGILPLDLSQSIFSLPIRRLEKPPRALPWSDVQKILQSIPLEKRPGKRDYALLLTMATYGLGAAEVLGLTLDDVDWRQGILRVRRPKTGVSLDLPLLPGIAKALVKYLKQERPPHTKQRQVFLATGMPHAPITSGTIRHRVRLYALLGGVKAPILGAHIFRHSHACKQVDDGTNIKVLSDLLGHRQPASTSVYVRVALRRLRTVSLPVPK